MQLFKVYPLTDERVKLLANKYLMNIIDIGGFLCIYSHYSIEHNFFCNEDDEEWCDNYIISDYDKDYLEVVKE